jgi:excisionase family DNA binding protein
MRESARGPLISLEQVCGRLRVSRFTLWRMVKRGEFPAAADTGKRRALWHGLDVNDWCKANAAHFERVLARRLPVSR